MRDDDPDLVRAGAHTRWEDALAEGTGVVGERFVDLDGDGVAERVATIAPRADPAPQNTLSGLVILERRFGGWRASVLFRPAWIGDQSARHRTPTATLTFHRERRRHRLVLAVGLMNVEERPEGHGRECYPQRLTMLLAWRGVRTVAEDLCHYGFEGPWRGARLDCAWIAGTEESARCGPLGRALSELDPQDPTIRDTPLTGWCRAEAAAHAHDLVIAPAPCTRRSGRPLAHPRPHDALAAVRRHRRGSRELRPGLVAIVGVGDHRGESHLVAADR